MAAKEAPVTAVKPSDDQPVTATMEVTPGELTAGQTFQLIVHVDVASAHHIYATNSIGKPFIPTTLSVTLPSGVEAVGPWIVPEPIRRRNGDLIYTDSILFRRSARLHLNIPVGRLSISGDLRYQACTEELCWPPRTLQLSSTIDVHPIKR